MDMPTNFAVVRASISCGGLTAQIERQLERRLNEAIVNKLTGEILLLPTSGVKVLRLQDGSFVLRGYAQDGSDIEKVMRGR